MTNKEISAQFSLLSKLMDVHGENSFKSKSYSNAAFAIGKLPFEIEEAGIEAIENQRGFGKGMINSILQIMDDEKLEALEEIKSRTPEGVLELLSIRGIGAKKVGQLWHELEIETPGDLLYACEENRLIALKGFGAKTQTTIKEKLEFYFSNQGSLLWSQAEAIMPSIISLLKSIFPNNRFEVLGDYYWQNETVKSFRVVHDNYLLLKELDYELWEDLDQNNEFHYFRYNKKFHFDFASSQEKDFEENKFLFSFSDDILDVIAQESIAFKKFTTEEAAFEKLGMQFMPPYLRNNFAAFEQAKQKSLPKIIQPSDIKGVIHNHTKWSDGVNTIEQMANACLERGYEYFVLSDHSKTSFYANGLSEQRIAEQQAEIDIINEKLKPFRVFKSIECDILGDGSLDYEDDVLATFDVVIVSVHQNLNMTEEKAMARLINAIENPYTSILGHCTGRLLLSRAGYPINHEKIIDACAANDVVIEINANPRRLDIDWRWIAYALEKDVMLSINPDAHRIEGIDDIRYGVQVAQKGMLPSAMNLSSFSLNEFEEFLMHQHQKRL